MAQGQNGEILQAVEININTFIGTASNEGGASSEVHLLESGDVIFHFPDGDKVLSDVPAGMDFIAGASCTGVTSTASVIIS